MVPEERLRLPSGTIPGLAEGGHNFYTLEGPGVFAHGEAEVVAQNIARSITGKAEPARFDGHGEYFIEAGDGKAGFGRGNFYAEPCQ